MAAVDRGRYRCVIGPGQRGHGDEGPRAGPQRRSWSATRSAWPATLRRARHAGPRRPGRAAHRRCCAGRPTTPTRSSGSIVANADQLVIVTALADPPPRPRLIDRFLVAAYDAGLEPLLCLTKSDLAGPESILRRLRAARASATSCSAGRWTDGRLDELRALLAGRLSVLVGHSGVGKSTLVNALIPDADRAVGTVSPVTGRGRHTSSSAVALRAARRRLDHRHAGPAQLRARPHVAPTGSSRAFPDLADGHRGVPAGLRPPRARTAPWTTGSPARAAPRRPAGSTRCAGCCAAARAWPANDATEQPGSVGRSAPAGRAVPGHGQCARLAIPFARAWRASATTCGSPTSWPTPPTTSPCAGSARSTCASRPSPT